MKMFLLLLILISTSTATSDNNPAELAIDNEVESLADPDFTHLPNDQEIGTGVDRSATVHKASKSKLHLNLGGNDDTTTDPIIQNDTDVLSGFVITIEATQVATQALTEEEISHLISEIAAHLNLNTTDNIAVSLSYSTKGVMKLGLEETSGLSNAEIEKSVKSALAKSLGIPEQYIEVSYDEETGEITYTITMDDFDSLNKIHDFISNPTFLDVINKNLKGDLDISVKKIDISDEIQVKITFIVTVDEYDPYLEHKVAKLKKTFEASGYGVNIGIKNLKNKHAINHPETKQPTGDCKNTNGLLAVGPCECTGLKREKSHKPLRQTCTENEYCDASDIQLCFTYKVCTCYQVVHDITDNSVLNVGANFFDSVNLCQSQIESKQCALPNADGQCETVTNNDRWELCSSWVKPCNCRKRKKNTFASENKFWCYYAGPVHYDGMNCKEPIYNEDKTHFHCKTPDSLYCAVISTTEEATVDDALSEEETIDQVAGISQVLKKY